MEWGISFLLGEPIAAGGCEVFLEDISGSCAELGQDAACITWRNARAVARCHLDEMRDADWEGARDHFREYGAWDQDEIDSWSTVDLLALVIQEAAGELRNMERHGCDYENEGGRVVISDDGLQAWIYLGI